ncbi:MAG: phosphoenolpyruvate hydrolase family protein [Rhodoferax sp.]|nr:phosphoenolpyruvate hydrolase family protein [Rhodoferax sp.]
MSSAASVLAGLRAKAHTASLVVCGVGSGLTAQGAVKGGADMLACYSTACFRVKGLPSALSFLPYSDANDLMLGSLPEVIAASSLPVIAGIGCHDPRRSLGSLIGRVEELGAIGITNEPFIGAYGSELRAQLDAAGLGFEREVALVQTATSRGLLTLAWAWSADDARRMVQAGSEIIGAMLGFGGPAHPPAQADAHVQDKLKELQLIVRAARDEKPDTIVLIHGGPFDSPEQVRLALEKSGADGYVSGSSGERTPAIQGIGLAVASYRFKKQSSGV